MDDFSSVSDFFKPESEDIHTLTFIADEIGISLDTYLLYRVLLKLNGDVFISHNFKGVLK